MTLMIEPMQNDLARTIELVNGVQGLLLRRSVLKGKMSLLLATSGGQDSACLTAIVFQLVNQWKWQVGVVSCNHLWQQDSFYALFHVARVGFWTDQQAFFAIAPREIGNEARARSWRYNTTYRIARLYGYSTVCTGQTGSDRVETTLINLFRGSGARGLSSLPWNRLFVASFPERLYLSSFIGTIPCQQLLLFYAADSCSYKRDL